ncbi:MAG: NosD domain-containing protein, partial [Bacteroidota bacterium]
MKSTARFAGLLTGLACSVIFFTPNNLLAQTFITPNTCPAIGEWNQAQYTCTLTKDIEGPIIFQLQDITLDGAGYTIATDTGWNDAIVWMEGLTATLQNVHLVGDTRHGIRLTDDASLNRIENVVISGPLIGISNDGDDNHFSNITISNAPGRSDTEIGISVFDASDTVFESVGIERVERAVVLDFSPNTWVSDSYISECETGVTIGDSDSSRVTNSILSACDTGLELENSERILIEDNYLGGSPVGSGERTGISLIESETLADSILQGNLITGWDIGIDDQSFYGGGGGDPTPSFSWLERQLKDWERVLAAAFTTVAYAQASGPLVISQNDFVANTEPHAITDAAFDTITFGVSTGNYWDVYDDPGEGCLDGDSNSVCDEPYERPPSVDDDYLI